MCGAIICIISSLLYNCYIIFKYKRIPISLSETAYILGGSKKYLFSLYCLVVGFSLLSSLFEIIPPDYEFLPFLLITGLLFSGFSPNFRDKLVSKVHYISAIISFCAFLIYMLLCLNLFWVLSYGIIFGLLCILKRSSYVYFAEILSLIVLIINIFIYHG